MKRIIFLSLLGITLSQPATSATVRDVSLQPEKMQTKSSNHFKARIKNLSALETSCGYDFANFTDERQNKETVAVTVNALGVDEWLAKMKEQLNEAPNQAKEGVNIKVLPKLTRLYAYNEAMNINGVTALMLDFEVDGKVLDRRHYRGFYSKLNWANGDGEFLTAINYSSHNAMIKIVKDLRSVCKLAIEKSS